MAHYLLQVIGTNAILATLLAGCVFAVSKCLHRPALLHCLWIIVLTKLLMPASLSVPLVAVRTETENTTDTNELTTGALMNLLATHSADTLHESATPTKHWWTTAYAALAVWIVGAFACAAWIAWQAIAFGRLLRRAREAPLKLQNQAEAIALELGLRHCPQVCIVQANISPLLWSLGHTRVVLPASLLRELNSGEVNGVLAHELMHLKRRDHWLRWLEVAAVAIYWWLPVAWWARRQLRAAEELCCDLAVLERWPARAKDYARTLLKSNDWLTSRLPVPQTASGFGSAPFLKRRITMILSKNLSRRLSWPARVAVVLGAAAVLPLSPMSLRGDDDAGSKVVTIEIKKDGTVTVSVGPQAKKQAEIATSAVAQGLQYIARVQQDGGIKIQQADKEQHRPLTISLDPDKQVIWKLDSNRSDDWKADGLLKIIKPDDSKPEAPAEKPKAGEAEKPKESEAGKSATLTASGLLLQLAGQHPEGEPKGKVSLELTNDEQAQDQPKRVVSVEFTNDQAAEKQSETEKDWKHVIVKDANIGGKDVKLYISGSDGQLQFFNSPASSIATQAAASEAQKATAEAQVQFTSALQQSIAAQTAQAAAQSAVANVNVIRQKEAQLEQLSAQLKVLQAEVERLRAKEKEQTKNSKEEKGARQ